MEKTVKDKAKSKPESQSSQKVNRKVNWSKSKSTQVNPEAKRQRNTSLGTEIFNSKGYFLISIDYTPKSPTYPLHSTNGYLNSPTSPPPRVPPPPPTQENTSMDITLTLSPITPLDVQFNTPSPSPPIFGHPIPWNLLEAHEDSCVLPSNSKAKENNGGKKVIKGSLLGDLAKRVKNIDGKMLCKDGNHRNLTVAIMGNLGNDTVGSGSFAAMVHGRKQDYEFLKRLLNMEDGEDRGHICSFLSQKAETNVMGIGYNNGYA
ncbi:hypothetical protein Tco_1227558 [Tanacetum coccineum]